MAATLRMLCASQTIRKVLVLGTQGDLLGTARQKIMPIRLRRNGDDSQTTPTWSTYLYQLQEQAPQPKCIPCLKEVPNRPRHYGKEFHGKLSQHEVDRLLEGEGSYLVRSSDRAPDACTLAIRFNNEIRNYKIYYDGKFYVGEKRFDSVYDLVADGLIHFYIVQRAGDYIKTLSQESNFQASPYRAFKMKRKRPESDTSFSGGGAEAAPASPEDELFASAKDVIDYEKQHVFKVQNFVGLQWCDFCAHFMWGITAQGVKCQDCGIQAHKKCSENLPYDCMPDMKYVKRTFGVMLTTLVKAQKSEIPIVVEKCIKEIEHRGLDSEGLYRVAGFKGDIEAVRMAFDKDAGKADISFNKYHDVNTICSALKLYFRLLPIPLITPDVYKKLLEIIQKTGLSVEEQVRLMKEAISALPPAHFNTFKFLCVHLGKVIDNQSKNMMSAKNLATVFAPTLMRSDDPDPMAGLRWAMFELQIMDVILSNHIAIFGK
ncbi:hypothetical protein BsWGS_25616 [Bradybaena similaris]